MNFLKKCFIIIIVFMLMMVLIITLNKITKATTETNMIIVTGNVKDKNNTKISNVEVSFIDTSTNTPIATILTDSMGEYIVNVPEGKYKVEFKYPRKYNTEKINVRKYELYDKNLELGLVYSSELEDKKIKYFDAKFTENLYNFRIIRNPYLKEEDIEEQIRNLQLDSKSEHAFHNLTYEKYKGVTIILSNKQESEIQKYIDNHLNGDYNSIICNCQESMSMILGKMYAKLGKDSKHINVNAIEEKNDVSANTIEIDFSSSTIIDVNLEQKNDEIENPISSTGDYYDFISGQIKVGNEMHNKDVLVKLVNIEDGSVVSTVNTNNGNYSIAYPGNGSYRLEFEFENTNEFNGQYYEADKISNNNCMTETNRKNINKYYKTIDYKKEGNLDNYKSNITEKIKGKSDSFNVSAISNNYNPNDNKIVKNVLLKQREKFSLTVEENVNKFKIILNNGQVFKNYNLKENLNNENYRIRLFNITMENKLSYGAKLLVEYEIKVTNNSNIDCTGYTLLNRFENLEFSKNQYQLSNVKSKNGDKWNVIKESNVKALTGNNKFNDDATDVVTYLKLEDDGIGANKEEYHYITLTRSLDAENDSTIFNGIAELVEYKNGLGRRNYEDIVFTDNVMDGIIRSGNYTTSGKEADTALSEDIAILPPTGIK